ncbi:hypothetical protein SAMN05428966_102370 [Massilia sp. PDC64]|nr:hypothetical protein SAMN05428966_102370 [Massilia sp. PDC64]
MRAAGIPKELRMIVVGHTPTDDVHDPYCNSKNDLSIADRKHAVNAFNFNNVLNYDGLKARRLDLPNCAKL